MGEVHEDPMHRYLRCEFSQLFGRTSIYKCLDQEEGIPADWNEIEIKDVPPDRLNLLKTFLSEYSHCSSNRHLVQIYRAWIDPIRNTLIYITEIYSHKTLRQYVREVAHHPTKNAISKWCTQIITGLESLHHCQHPIIHNNLSCETILIDAGEGALKIAVPSLESLLFGWVSQYAAYEAQKNFPEPKSDVWALGLCVMEMATGEIPYNEKKSPKDAILQGDLPGALGQVSDPSVADFITNCLLPVAQRPSIENLFETTLLQECYIPPQEETKQEEVEQKHVVIQPNPLDELLAKQKLEKDALIEKQKEQRKALREKLRAKGKKRASLRDLLNESA